jgi:hypothetical protein
VDPRTDINGARDGVTHGGCRSAGGRVVATLFFSVFLLLGGLFVVMILSDAIRQTAVWFWPEQPCTIVESGVESTGSDEEPYRPSVRFEYEIDGRVRSSRAVARTRVATASYDRARRVSDRYPLGSRTFCRVDPDSPSTAVLEAKPPWIVLVVFFPLIFVAVGGGGIFAVWRRSPMSRSLDATESISQRARKPSGLGTAVELGVGLLFTAVGGALTVFLLVVPMARLTSALGWIEVPARVVASTVRSWSTDDGTATRADVLYEYTVAGRTWRSNRLGFFPMSASGAESSRATVDRYPVGATVACFVDPDHAGRSVLDRRFRPVYLIGLIPLLFLLAGVAVSGHALRRRRAQRPSPEGAPSTTADTVGSGDGSLELEPPAGPLVKVVGMVIIAAFWNGIVSIFVWQAAAAFNRGHPDWFLTVFLIPFVLVGLALVGGVGYTSLAAFNPRPKLVIRPGSPRLGDRLQVDWRLVGAAGRIERLTLTFEGYEQATYRRGTDTHTDREVFAALPVVELPPGGFAARGTAQVEIPSDTMHSFASSNNAVVWAVHVHGDIPRWPDVDETFTIEVRPLARDTVLP